MKNAIVSNTIDFSNMTKVISISQSISSAQAQEFCWFKLNFLFLETDLCIRIAPMCAAHRYAKIDKSNALVFERWLSLIRRTDRRSCVKWRAPKRFFRRHFTLNQLWLDHQKGMTEFLRQNGYTGRWVDRTTVPKIEGIEKEQSYYCREWILKRW